MKAFAHFAVSIILVIGAGVVFEIWGGWIVMALVIGIPLLDYLLRSKEEK